MPTSSLPRRACAALLGLALLSACSPGSQPPATGDPTAVATTQATGPERTPAPPLASPGSG